METRRPSVLVPYAGPCGERGYQDIFVCLRPETNGVLVESILLKAMRADPEFRDRVSLAYLANLPGDFMALNRVVEEHYAVKRFFAERGGAAFTPWMRRAFEERFGLAFPEARVTGAFAAMSLLGLDEDGLFHLWVPDDCFCVIHGQSIKRYGELYIVNYDIPSLLRKNGPGTDVAAMVFRTDLGYDGFERVVRSMEGALVEAGIIREDVPPSYVFHYSKGPLEQILDATGYLYGRDAAHLPLEDISFAAYLEERGLGPGDIRAYLRHPIVRAASGGEAYLFDLTRHDSYEAAYRKLLELGPPPAAADILR